MIHECGMPGCSTLTFGHICLGCEQKKAEVQPVFPRGRPFARATTTDVTSSPSRTPATAVSASSR